MEYSGCFCWVIRPDKFLQPSGCKTLSAQSGLHFLPKRQTDISFKACVKYRFLTCSKRNSFCSWYGILLGASSADPSYFHLETLKLLDDGVSQKKKGNWRFLKFYFLLLYFTFLYFISFYFTLLSFTYSDWKCSRESLMSAFQTIHSDFSLFSWTLRNDHPQFWHSYNSKRSQSYHPAGITIFRPPMAFLKISFRHPLPFKMVNP